MLLTELGLNGYAVDACVEVFDYSPGGATDSTESAILEAVEDKRVVINYGTEDIKFGVAQRAGDCYTVGYRGILDDYGRIAAAIDVHARRDAKPHVDRIVAVAGNHDDGANVLAG